MTSLTSPFGLCVPGVDLAQLHDERVVERAGLVDHIIVVTRWYGGVHLGGDRFAHVVTAVRAYLAELERSR